MSKLQIGDTVYFSTVSKLMNEGIVMDIQDNCVKVKTEYFGIKYVMANNVFLTVEDLMDSESYHAAWFSQRQRGWMQEFMMRQPVARMATFW